MTHRSQSSPSQRTNCRLARHLAVKTFKNFAQRGMPIFKRFLGALSWCRLTLPLSDLIGESYLGTSSCNGLSRRGAPAAPLRIAPRNRFILHIEEKAVVFSHVRFPAPTIPKVKHFGTVFPVTNARRHVDLPSPGEPKSRNKLTIG